MSIDPRLRYWLSRLRYWARTKFWQVANPWLPRANQLSVPLCIISLWLFTFVIQDRLLVAESLYEPVEGHKIVPIQPVENPVDNINWFAVRCNEPLEARRIENRRPKPKERDSMDLTLENKKQKVPNWCVDEVTGIFRYFGPKQLDRRRTLVGVQRCLANKNLVFVGNSIVRYQYLNLAAFLTTGKWEECEEIPPKSSDEDLGPFPDNNSTDELPPLDISTICPLSFAPFHGTFNDFYQYTDKMMHTETSNEYCYCYRASFENPNMTARHGRVFARSRENRFFEARTPFGQVKMTFLSNFQNRVYLHSKLPPFAEKVDPTICRPGFCDPERNEGETFEYSTQEAIAEVVSKLKPTHAFISGWQAANIGCALMDLQSKGCGNNSQCKIWYITHTTNRNGHEKRYRQSCDIPIFDRLEMTRRLPKYLYFGDGLHLRASVNQEFNHRLLDTICGDYP